MLVKNRLKQDHRQEQNLQQDHTMDQDHHYQLQARKQGLEYHKPKMSQKLDCKQVKNPGVNSVSERIRGSIPFLF